MCCSGSGCVITSVMFPCIGSLYFKKSKFQNWLIGRLKCGRWRRKSAMTLESGMIIWFSCITIARYYWSPRIKNVFSFDNMCDNIVWIIQRCCSPLCIFCFWVHLVACFTSYWGVDRKCVLVTDFLLISSVKSHSKQTCSLIWLRAFPALFFHRCRLLY